VRCFGGWWQEENTSCFIFAEKAQNEHWEVVPGILGVAGKLLSLQE
jgi:hypothetical protein